MKHKLFLTLIVATIISSFLGVLLKVNDNKVVGEVCLGISTLCWSAIFFSFAMGFLNGNYKKENKPTV